MIVNRIGDDVLQSVEIDDQGMDFGCLCDHGGDGDAKEKVNDGGEILNGSDGEFPSVENDGVVMDFGDHHGDDGDDVVKTVNHGGEILKGNDVEFQSVENDFVEMGFCDQHGDGGGGDVVNDGVEMGFCDHCDGGGGEAMENVNDGVENLNGNDGEFRSV